MKIRSFKLFGTKAAAFAAILALPLVASANLVIDGSFEDITMADPLAGNLTTDGYEYFNGSLGVGGPWRVTGGTVKLVNRTGHYSWPAENGQYSLGLENSTTGGTIEQTIATTAGANYVLKFWLSAGDTVPGQTVIVAVLFGGQVKNFTLVSPGSAQNLASNGWFEETWVVTATGSTTQLLFQNLSSRLAPAGPAIDNIDIEPSVLPQVASVPESPTIIAGALIALPLIVSAFRILLKNWAAKRYHDSSL